MKQRSAPHYHFVHTMALIVVTASAAVRAAEPASSLEDASLRLTIDLVAWVGPAAKPENRPIIAVLAFTKLEGGIAVEGKRFAEELTTQLFLTKRFRVVERTLLDRVLSDNRLARDGILAPSSVSELGRLTNATAIVTGTIADLGTHQRINARVISTRDGQVLAAATVSVVISGARQSDNRSTATESAASARPAEDCMSLDPNSLSITPMQGKYAIVEGKDSLAFRLSKENDAERAIAVIRYYGFNKMCWIARPGEHSNMYLLVGDAAASGAMTGERCRPIEPSSLVVSKAGEAWLIRDAHSVVADFGPREAGAQRGLEVITYHGFTNVCTVGDVGDNFQYFRR